MNNYAKDDFTLELSKLLSTYAKDNLSNRQMAKAYMPAMVLEAVIGSFYITGITPVEGDISPVLSCTNAHDLANVIDIIECTSAKFATRYGSEMYKLFLDEIGDAKFNENVTPEFVVPFVAAISMLHIIEPVIRSSETYINRNMPIEFSKTNYN